MQTDMATTNRADAHAGVSAKAKKPYEPPRVDDLGPLAELTRAGGNQIPDGVTGSDPAT
jgi:hypothetical protein